MSPASITACAPSSAIISAPSSSRPSIPRHLQQLEDLLEAGDLIVGFVEVRAKGVGQLAVHRGPDQSGQGPRHLPLCAVDVLQLGNQQVLHGFERHGVVSMVVFNIGVAGASAFPVPHPAQGAEAICCLPFPDKKRRSNVSPDIPAPSTDDAVASSAKSMGLIPLVFSGS